MIILHHPSASKGSRMISGPEIHPSTILEAPESLLEAILLGISLAGRAIPALSSGMSVARYETGLLEDSRRQLSRLTGAKKSGLSGRQCKKFRGAFPGPSGTWKAPRSFPEASRKLQTNIHS